jgi:hypothetical protein
MRNQQKRTARVFGVMVTERSRLEERPTYQQVLTKFDFLPKNAGVAEAWAMWQRVCSDERVKKLAQEMERPAHRSLVSVTAGFKFYAAVLEAMSARSLSRLRAQITDRKPKGNEE